MKEGEGHTYCEGRCSRDRSMQQNTEYSRREDKGGGLDRYTRRCECDAIWC